MQSGAAEPLLAIDCVLRHRSLSETRPDFATCSGSPASPFLTRKMSGRHRRKRSRFQPTRWSRSPSYRRSALSAGPVLAKFCSKWKQWELNRAESMYYHGVYMEKVNLPSGLGYEAVGKVIAVGKEADPTLIGKRFGTIPGFSMSQYPVLAEEAVVPASVLAAIPDSFSAIRGRRCPGCTRYCTAYGALDTFRLKVAGGDFVIITACQFVQWGSQLSRSSRHRAVYPSRPPAVPPRRINSSAWALTTSSSRKKRTW